MARSRFVGDTGLTVRMTTVMFLLGALLVVLVVGIGLAFRSPGIGLLDGVRTAGVAHPADSLDESDLILPYPDATIDQVRQLLNDDGLIPG